MEPAKMMFGKYKEIEFLGRGSSGVVYKVEEVEEDGDVHVYALKKFEVAPCRSLSIKQRF